MYSSMIQNKHKMPKSKEAKVFQCQICLYKTAYKNNLKIHFQSIHELMTYQCQYCEYKASQKGNLKIHTQSIHEHKTYQCQYCEYSNRKGQSQNT